MKPTKNRFFCAECGRTKMVFETEKKAANFIKFNSAAIEEQTGYSPKRTYFCIACNGWHVTHLHDFFHVQSKTEEVLYLFYKEKEQKTLAKTERKLLRKKNSAKKYETKKLI